MTLTIVLLAPRRRRSRPDDRPDGPRRPLPQEKAALSPRAGASRPRALPGRTLPPRRRPASRSSSRSPGLTTASRRTSRRSRALTRRLVRGHPLGRSARTIPRSPSRAASWPASPTRPSASSSAAGRGVALSNPKVERLVAAARVARGEILFVSDSNVRVEPGDVARDRRRLRRPVRRLRLERLHGLGRALVRRRRREPPPPDVRAARRRPRRRPAASPCVVGQVDGADPRRARRDRRLRGVHGRPRRGPGDRLRREGGGLSDRALDRSSSAT